MGEPFRILMKSNQMEVQEMPVQPHENECKNLVHSYQVQINPALQTFLSEEVSLVEVALVLHQLVEVAFLQLKVEVVALVLHRMKINDFLNSKRKTNLVT